MVYSAQWLTQINVDLSMTQESLRILDSLRKIFQRSLQIISPQRNGMHGSQILYLTQRWCTNREGVGEVRFLSLGITTH